MTAVSLFDVLSRRDPTDPAAAARLARFAERLVDAALADLQRLRDDERAFTAARADDAGDDGLEPDLLRSLWQLYAQWASDAEQVLTRVRGLNSAGQSVRDADRLEDAHGSVRARLGVTPEQVLRAREQVQRGQAIPAKELRDDLRARLRA
jgi:hypothetical protein